MAQFSSEIKKKPCSYCKKPTPVRSTKELPFCSRICQSNYKMKVRYQGNHSEKLDYPKSDKRFE